MTKHKLVEIYEKNQELEAEGHIKGHKAKLLLNRCKQALKIIKADFTDEEYTIEKLTKHIEQLENYYNRHGYIQAIDYNLDARIDIHLLIRDYNLFKIEKGWLLYYDEKTHKSQQHWVESNQPICGYVGEPSSAKEPDWFVSKDYACKNCFKIKKEKLIKELKADPEYPKYINGEGSLSGSGEGLQYEVNSQGIKIKLRD